ncbi:response regulator [Desulforhopalus sp. IMCC35007]|uniref:response regulator n=1 Tax=Desulforhopalus sp. IMCC35007 TaxID=2569543 RepID=UPI00197AEF9F|nr:response regulator [Desulforhopalus sp. IMCC35007]
MEELGEFLEAELLSNEKRKKILVMDDEDMVGEIACQMLDFLGFDAVHVFDGQAAVETFQVHKNNGEPFNAVIMDLTIPGGMGGKEAVTEILAVDATAKVFVSSGYSTDPAMVNYREFGFTGVIVKPFDLAAIQEILDKLV